MFPFLGNGINELMFCLLRSIRGGFERKYTQYTIIFVFESCKVTDEFDRDSMNCYTNLLKVFTEGFF